MNNKSTAALEREAEAVRSQLAYTADSLREKMTPGQLVDEAAHYFRDSDGARALHNLRIQARDNPLPLALVGAGLAWFFMGGGPTARRLRSTAESYAADEDDRYVPDLWAGQSRNGEDEAWEHYSELEPLDGAGRAGGNGSDRRRAASAAKSAVSDAASAVSDAAGSAYSAAGEAASSAGETVSHTAEMARRRAARAGTAMVDRSTQAGRLVRRSFADVLDQEPLVIGAIGIAVGAAIAAMLPRTQYEDETLGPYRDQLGEGAEEAVIEGIERAKDIAAETYHAAKDEADRQGLTSGSENTVAGRMAEVAKSAATAAEETARDKMESDRSS